jgi:flagellar hook assembly protein FlgD
VFSRAFFITAALALALAPSAFAQGTTPSLLMPGVTYTKRVQFTPRGPVVLNVITAPRPGGLYSLQPVLSNEAIVGRETLTAMETRLGAGATVAGVNGDLFDLGDGHPSGVVMRNGVLEHPPFSGRTSLGIAADGMLRPERIGMLGFWQGTGQRLRIGLNDPPSANGFSLFTPAYGPLTPPATAGAGEIVVRPFPKVTAATDLTGVVTDVIPSTAGRTAIPADGAIIQARGTSVARLATDAPVRTTITVRYTLVPAWDGIVNAIGGGPRIVTNGTPIYRANEDFAGTLLSQRLPRSAIGQRADGKLLLVAVDGKQPGYSVGMTNFELALAMMQLGAVTATALDSGGSTAMAFDGQLLSRPSDPAGERPVSDALLVAYTGVYVAPPAEPVLSPNGDGVAELESLSYKVVRPSTVQASLVGPGNVTLPIDAGPRAPGIYRFTWTGSGADGSARPEGTWRFTVTSTDDQGQVSVSDRPFTLNNTLSTLAVEPKLLTLGKKTTRLLATFKLRQSAKITATVETEKGVVVRVLTRAQLSAGNRSLSWNGRIGSGGLAYGGTYQVHVAAANELGRVDLYAPFRARR